MLCPSLANLGISELAAPCFIENIIARIEGEELTVQDAARSYTTLLIQREVTAPITIIIELGVVLLAVVVVITIIVDLEKAIDVDVPTLEAPLCISNK